MTVVVDLVAIEQDEVTAMCRTARQAIKVRANAFPAFVLCIQHQSIMAGGDQIHCEVLLYASESHGARRAPPPGVDRFAVDTCKVKRSWLTMRKRNRLPSECDDGMGVGKRHH